MAKKKYVPVRMDGEIFESVKKVALSQGKSVSETVGMLVMKSLDYGVDPGQGIDPLEMKKMIEEGLKPLITSVAVMRAEVRGIGGQYREVPDPGLSPEVVHYLIEKLAGIESFLKSMTEDRPNGESKIRDWNKKAKDDSEKDFKKLHMERSVCNGIV
ncbi:MAG: hypothetical protein ACYCT9_12725 [Leptospirillum sp.]